jgi:isopenicillin N synthase-like dioxygenase
MVTLAAVRHTDASGLSLLWQQQPGLQAQAPDGTWRDVPTVPNTVSVHLGTVLELMTAGRVPATPHRVIDHGIARQSIGFFVEPGLATRLAPIAEGDATPGDLSGTYGWHLQERFHAMRGFEDLVPAPG